MIHDVPRGLRHPVETTAGKEGDLLGRVLEAHGTELRELAQSWLMAGAGMVAIRTGERTLAIWGGTGAEGSELRVPLIAQGRTVGELLVAGVAGEAAMARLQADARLLSSMAALEGDVENAIGELSDAQDQLLALYDLAQTVGKQTSVDGSLRALAQECQRLAKVGWAFAVLDGPSGPTVAQHPTEVGEEPELHDVLRAVQHTGHRLLRYGERVAPLLSTRADALLAVPVVVRGRIAGALGLVDRVGGPFTSPDIKLAEAIAHHAGTQLERALLHEESLNQARLQAEIALARDVQLRLLSGHLPRIAGLDVYATSVPALQVGGDFYDFGLRRDGSLAFAVGDVSGKGMSAALLMAMGLTVIRSEVNALTLGSPAEVLERINRDLYDDFTRVGMFTTVFAARYTPTRREIIYANGGHSPVIFIPAGGRATLLEADGAPMGVLPYGAYANQHLRLGEGDVLILATDGLSEARGPGEEMFGCERLLAVAQSASHGTARAIGEAMYAAVREFGSGRPQDDDQTVAVLKVEALS